MKTTTKRLLAILAATVALSARAEVLVYEGFHPADYGNVAAAGNVTASDKFTPSHTIGVSANMWYAMGGSQIKVYGENYGLALPAEMASEGFAALGGSIGLNPTGGSSDHRAMTHTLSSDVLKASSGTLYFRVLLNLDATAASKLAAGATLAEKSGGYFGFGLCASPNGNNYYAPTHLQSALSFVIWKNSSNQYVLSFVHTTASGVAFTSYPILTGITLGTTYLCYAEVQVGAGTDGKEILRAGAMATDAYTADTPWAALGGASGSVEVELFTDSGYPTCMAVAGPYQTGSGRFRADEIVVGTELSDILLATTSKPKLSNGALSLANGTYAVSASLANSAANVSYVLSNGTTATTNAIAAFADGDTVSAAFAAPTDDTTYEVLLVAENAGGETAELSLGTIYGGTLSLTKVSDGSEVGLTPAMLTVSRANDDPLPLVVNYSFADGTAVAGTNYVDDAGSVTIPAGQTSATITVHPLVDVATAADTAMSVSLAAGNYTAPAAGVAVTIANFTTPAGLDYWVGSTATDGEYLASNGDNWSLGRAPNATETAVFDGDFSTVDCTWDAAAPYTVGSWLQTNGYTGTVTFKTTFPEADATFTSFAIAGNAALHCGNWTHPAATAATEALAHNYYRLKVSVGGSLTVASTAAISVSAKGTWAKSSGGGGIGGSYGGQGNWGTAFGSLLEPSALGESASTTGSSSTLAPAYGGGSAWIEVAGTATVDGSILADGIGVKGEWADYSWGSGGSVYLKASGLGGSGRISANGNSDGGSKCKNSASGGRISILLTASAEMALPEANVTAYGSANGSMAAGAGTIVVRTTSLSNGRLILRNRASLYDSSRYYPTKERTTPIVAGETWTFDEIVFGANGVLRVPAGATLSLPNGLASVSGSSALSAERTSCGILLDGGTLDIADTAATEHVVGNGQWMLSPNAPLVLNGNLTVQGGAAVGAIHIRNAATNSFNKMDLTVKGDMTVASDGYILTEGAGLNGTDEATLYAGTTYGSHGGAFGASSDTAAPSDVVYDSILSPSLPGNRSNAFQRYSSGVAFLTVEGALVLNGTASANAVSAHWGGGAGAINIVAGSLSGSGKITANGNEGNNWDADNNYHLYPGGGRVSVRLTDADATFSGHWVSNILARGVAWNAGNGTRLHHSTAGTVYLQDGTQPEGAGTVRIFQNNAAVNWTTVCTNDFTAFPSTLHGGENDDLRKVALEIGGGAHVFVSVDKARVDSLSIAEHSTLNLYGRTLTVRTARIGGAKLPSGTYAAGDTAVDGFVTDSGEGGSLVITGGATVFIVN